MATGREIKSKISSVKNTQKITRAMDLVAASKMRKAKERMLLARPYADAAARIISHTAKGHLEEKHTYFLDRNVKSVAIIVVSSDRGLCGGLNVNLFKKVVKEIEVYQKNNVEVKLCLIGKKARAFFQNVDVKIISCKIDLGDSPSADVLMGTVAVALNEYNSETVDRVIMFSNKFVNTIKQVAELQQLVPVIADETESLEHYWDYIYEPDDQSLLTILINRYIESQVYKNVVENIACEQASRMVAMKAATDNATSVIKTLKRQYNKARQAAITQEIAEICAGAATV